MCGLACIIEFGGEKPPLDAVRGLSQSLIHRGPDDDGTFVHENIAMAFRRLSIIDLSAAGHQPMASADGRYAIVFNGEIFNYVELRAELEGKGYAFRSSSDTEVLLNAYIEWKEACLDRLNGMWAFIIADTVSHTCFCSRDRFGVKPLYFLRTQRRMLFASEVWAIVHSGLCRQPVNLATMAEYLVFGELDCTNETFHEGIEAVAPATWMRVGADGHVRSGQYWTLPDDTDAAPSGDELYSLFHDAVRVRLRSDVPVGVFLSGGLDSTSIMCAAADELGRDHPISAYAFMSPEYDESRYIRDTISQTGATLVPLDIDPANLWEQLVRMMRYQDGPVHTPSALIGFCLYSLAAGRGTKVILNGQGADETFAGYSNYFFSYWQSLIREARFHRLAAQLQAYGGHHQIAMLTLLRRVAALFVAIQLNQLRAYRWAAAVKHRRQLHAHPYYTHQLLERLPRYRRYNGDRGLGSALRSSVTVSSLPLYLRVEDRNSMAHSIEARLPFLDYRLVSAVMRTAATCKLDGYWNKALLRNCMQGKIPESVRTRPDKMGFATPDAKWVRAWAGEIEGIFRSRSFGKRGFFNVPALLAALANHVHGVRDCHEDLFRAVQVEMYMRATETAS